MATERMPCRETEDSSFLARPLQAVARLAVRFPKSTIVFAAIVSVAALALSAARLGFRNSRADLLNPRSEYHQRWLAYIQEFDDKEDVIVAVESDSPERVLAAMQDAADAIARRPDLFRAVMHEFDLSRLRAKGLHYLPAERLAQIDAMLEQAAPILQGRWNALPPGAEASLFGGESFGDEGLDAFGRRPLVADDGRLGVVMLKLATNDKESFDPHTQGIDALRRIVANVQERHPQTRIGLTGLPVIENDEMRSSQTSMSRASLLSLVGVAFVFLAGFGGWRHPLIGNVALMAGMAWAFGFATLAIGHLNILSSAFGAILIGQGIDFGVYYLAGYLHQRKQTRSTAEALIETSGCVGPGIATGAFSTAIAFFMAGFTEFTGVAELGMIAGGGILLCFLAAMLLLPAMIQACDGRRPAHAMPSQLELGGFLHRIHARPVLTLTLLAAAVGVAGVGLHYLRYDHNLMNLQPAGLESVRLAQAVMERMGQNAYYALSMAGGREEALARKEAFLRQPSVERVEEIASALPDADPRRRELVERIHARLAALPQQPPREVPPVAAGVLEPLLRLREVSDPTPPSLSDLSPSLTARFVGRTGKYLLKVYGKADIWDMPATEQFIREVRAVDANATGNPMQIYEASRQMKRSYEQAAIYATLIVCLVVYLDFGSLRYTLLALLPLGLGMMLMFGLMGLVNIPLNAANMIVLPLILGIGVDNGVHVVHDYRSQRSGRYRISGSTANAVFINSLGNMVGFGSLMIASHQGLQSLGRVLTIGMACCLLSALAMPSLLALFQSRPPAPVDAEEADSDEAEAPPLAPQRIRADSVPRRRAA